MFCRLAKYLVNQQLSNTTQYKNTCYSNIAQYRETCYPNIAQYRHTCWTELNERTRVTKSSI